MSLYSDIARLEAAAGDDLVDRALAMHARRAGSLGSADARYQALLSSHPDDVMVVNNAASIRFGLGHLETALELYETASNLEDSPEVLFNLSQAYGRAFNMDALAETLERAQALNGDLVAELTTLQAVEANDFVVDLPLAPGLLWGRVRNSETGAAIAAEFRQTFAPGALGSNLPATATVFALMFVGSAGLRFRYQPSRMCSRCDHRLCPRCDLDRREGTLCGGCHRLFNDPESTDRSLRVARLAELRKRDERNRRFAVWGSVLVPGAAGMIAKSPVFALLGGFFFSISAVSLIWHDGVVPDPLLAGSATLFGFGLIALVSALLYAVVVASSLTMRRGR